MNVYYDRQCDCANANCDWPDDGTLHVYEIELTFDVTDDEVVNALGIRTDSGEEVEPTEDELAVMLADHQRDERESWAATQATTRHAG